MTPPDLCDEMKKMNLIFFRITLILYTGGSLLFLLSFSFPFGRLLPWGAKVFSLGFLTHSATFLIRWWEGRQAPCASLHESFSFFAWGLMGVFLLLRKRQKVDVLGAFVGILALLMLLGACLTPKEIVPLPPVLQSLWLPIHVILAFSGDGAFALAFCAGVMYLIQEHMLKNKRFGPLSRRLPSLEVLDEINYRCLTIGFPLLSVGIITGAIWARYAWGSYWSWDPKETWSFITWLIYAALLHQRLTIGWRGRKAAIMAIVGFGAVIFTFLGVNFLLGGLHSYTS